MADDATAADVTEAPAKPVRTRDAEATRKRILAAAKREFARFGLGGARVDRRAEGHTSELPSPTTKLF